MALLEDLWASLTEPERIAATYINSMVEKQISANKILSTMKDAGIFLRRAQGLAIVRRLKEVDFIRPYVNALNMSKLPSIDRLPKSLYPLSKQYSYKVKMFGLADEDTEPTFQYISIVTNDLITKQQAVNAAFDYLDSQPEVYKFTADRAMVEEIRRSA